MLQPTSTAAGIAAATLMLTLGAVRAADDAKYPNWKGQWSRLVVPAVEGGLPNPGFDPYRPRGRGQQAPLTPEYAKVLEDSIADQEKGGLGNYPSARCIPSGMPRMMTFYEFEYDIIPDITYILIGGDDHYRRIFTDARDWPPNIQPTYSGYSIGRWIDEDADGRYDGLEVETRGLRDPAPTRRAVCRCTSITNRSSRNASISTKPIPTYFTMKSPRSTMP